ncbi:MAG: glutathione S-transferase family protein [Polyangiaceae bacterium]
MKLHYFPLSTYSQKTLTALHERQIDFEPVYVDLTTAEGRAAYKKIYPIGKIPLLVLDDGHLIPESTIIIEYIDKLPSAKGEALIPTEADAARQTRFYDRVFDQYVNNPFQKIFFDGRKPESERDPAGVAVAKEQLDISYKLADKTLAGKTWIMGDRFSMADCSLAPSLAYLRHTYPFDAYPNLVSYFGRVVERPSFAKVLAEAQPFIAKLMNK